MAKHTKVTIRYPTLGLSLKRELSICGSRVKLLESTGGGSVKITGEILMN